MSTRFALCIVLCLTLTAALAAQQPEEHFRRASQAYSSADYTEAIRLLHALEREGYAGFHVYYNLGNAYYKNGNLGASTLYFEKALLQDPGNEDVLHNIRVVRARTRDRIEPIPLLFFVQWWNDVKSAFLPKAFFFWSVVFLWLLAGSLFVFFAFRRVLFRRLALACTLLTGILFLLAVTLYSARIEQLAAHRNAVIMPDEVTVRSAPDASAVESFTVHEGLKVEILESRDDLYRIRLADGKDGWIPRDAAERI
ncbi:MAG: tetratricopeptide repeat protein [Bacteroidota bacterium]|nr:tetratricopeptide repeat protein [Bacteroidota bacterium]